MYEMSLNCEDGTHYVREFETLRLAAAHLALVDPAGDFAVSLKKNGVPVSPELLWMDTSVMRKFDDATKIMEEDWIHEGF